MHPDEQYAPDGYDMGPFPKTHPRTEVIARAANELESFLLEFRKRHLLTSAEYTAILTSQLNAFAWWMTRKERGIT